MVTERVREGDIVHCGLSPTLYKVTRVKIAKLFAIESLTGRKVEFRIEHARKADNPTDYVEPVESFEPKPELALGTAVRFKRANEPDKKGVWVVINKTAGGWKIARLGGGGGMRYYYNLDSADLVPVSEINDVDWSVQ